MRIERISYLNYTETNNNSANREEMTINEKEFLTLCEIFPICIGSYYRRRWPYLKEVIDFVKRERPKHVIELGAYLIPLIRNSHVMDIEQGMPQQKYVHDATVFPWPIGDDQYDLFIGLQVWEHLDQKQEEAFKEVMRVSRMAVISFPYRWYCPGDIHHNIDTKTITRWTMHVPPEKIVQVGRWIIYFFRFSGAIREKTSGEERQPQIGNDLQPHRPKCEKAGKA